AGCATGQVGLGGTCQADPCMGAKLMGCGGGGSCKATCVPTTDPCAGVTCTTGRTCVDGVCLAGCFLQPCSGVTCPSGQTCDRDTGKCATLNACNANCGTGRTCALTCAAANPCAGVQCPSGQS